jgi:bifunctional DNase/RNase
MSTDELVEMTVESVRVHMLSSHHVVILKATDRERYLPIWIGPTEANAIAMRLQGLSPERPLTHDLFASLLESLQVRLDRVVVSDLAEETFHARIFLEADGRQLEVDSRPSDAIALAVRAATPIFATEAVLDRAGVTPSLEDADRLSVFREFVNSLEIEDEPPSQRGGERRLLD